MPLSGETPLDISNSAVIPFDGVALGGDLVAFRTNLNSLFLSYQLSGKRKKKIAKLAQGKSIVHSNPEYLMKLYIFYPTKEEQNKIVNTLNLLAKKINILRDKIATLKKYKDGIAKTLIFEQIKHSKTSVTDICSITTGKLDANACVPNGKYKFFTCSKDDLTINSYAFDCEAILVAGNGEVGFTKYYKGKFNAYQRTYVLTQMKIEPLLVKISIDLQISSVIRKETNKGAMPYIKLGTFKNIKVPNLTDKVQNELNCISNIENMMSNFQQQLKSLEKIKKYLLNSLFI